MLHSALINVMVKAARRAGRSLKRDLGEIENLQVSLKGPANFVSAADRRAEQMLYDDLIKARPGYGFLGEEGGTREGTDKSNTWIVDPLDGTTNFLHGIPQFAISIGLQRDDTIIAGVIYNPANDELYIAERGKGAFLNDQRLRVAGRRKLDECVIACGLPHIGRGDHGLALKEMAALQNRIAGFRRFGAASLDMAFVAAGRLDGYWERNLKSWDMAAFSRQKGWGRRSWLLQLMFPCRLWKPPVRVEPGVLPCSPPIWSIEQITNHWMNSLNKRFLPENREISLLLTLQMLQVLMNL